MPYEVKKDGDNFTVVNSETGDVKATHEPPDAKDKAERQVKLLSAIEKDPAWADGDMPGPDEKLTPPAKADIEKG